MAKKGHSEACRKRIESMMREDVDDKKKIEASDERITHQIARRLEQEDRKRKSAPDAEVPNDCDQVREGEEEADENTDAQKKRFEQPLMQNKKSRDHGRGRNIDMQAGETQKP